MLLIFVVMKKSSLLIFFLAIADLVFCQPQNLSFELWDSNDPSYWATSNFFTPGSAIQTTDAHGGAFALNMNVILDSTGTAVGPYAINTFPYTTMPEVLTFWAKGNLQGNNNFNASFSLTETDSLLTTLAYGDETFTSISNVYQYKFVNVLPLAGASLLGMGSIYFAINAPVGSALNVNTTLFIDDLYLGADNTSIEKHLYQSKVIEEVYPNPAQDLAFLIFNQKKYGMVILNVYDLLGNKLQEILHENMMEGRYKAEINTSQLPQGVYLCKLSIDEVEYCVKLIKH